MGARRHRLVDTSVGLDNINGPCVFKHDGQYVLLYASHDGDTIWQSFADRITGPYTGHRPFFTLADSPCVGHIASPDVEYKAPNHIRLYYHGVDRDTGKQATFYSSWNGITWMSSPYSCGPYYLRHRKVDGQYLALAHYRGATLLESAGGCHYFEVKHGAFKVRHPCWMGDAVLFTRIGDAPERILRTTDWFASEHEVIRATEDWEGGLLPPDPSRRGIVREPVNQLRDPFFYEGYLFYAFAGEQGIACTRIT